MSSRILRSTILLEWRLIVRSFRRTAAGNGVTLALGALLLLEFSRTSVNVATVLRTLPAEQAAPPLVFIFWTTALGFVVYAWMNGSLPASHKIHLALASRRYPALASYVLAKASPLLGRQAIAPVTLGLPALVFLSSWGSRADFVVGAVALTTLALLAPSVLSILAFLWATIPGRVRPLLFLAGGASVVALRNHGQLLYEIVSVIPPGRLGAELAGAGAAGFSALIPIVAIAPLVFGIDYFVTHRAPAARLAGRRSRLPLRALAARATWISWSQRAEIWREIATALRWRRFHTLVATVAFVLVLMLEAELPAMQAMGPLLFAAAPVVLIGSTMGNGLAVDGPGIQAFRLLRVPWQQVWRAKDVVFFVAVGALEALGWSIAAVRWDWALKADLLAFAAFTTAALALWVTLLMRVTSVLFYEPRDITRVGGDYVSLSGAVAMGVGTALFLLPAALLAFLFDVGRIGSQTLVAGGAFLFALSLLLRWLTRDLSGRIARTSWELVLQKARESWKTT